MDIAVPDPPSGSSVAELLGTAAEHHRNGRGLEAEACCRRILEIDPEHVETLVLLGKLARQTQREALAVACMTNAIRLKPSAPDCHFQLGNVLCAFGLWDEAIPAFRAAIGLNPDYAEAYNNLGNALQACGSMADAEVNFRQVTRLRPDLPEAWYNLGNVLLALDRQDESIACYREALRLRPAYPAAQFNLGNVLTEVGNPAEAVVCYREAIRQQPDFGPAHGNLAYALQLLGRFGELEICCREAVRLMPRSATAHHNLAMLLLTTGRMEEGWEEYEWRWLVPGQGLAEARNFPQPLWDGAALRGRTLLVHAEQGFGDALQFCRYVSLLPRDGRVVIEAQPPLLRLLRSLTGFDQIVARGDPLPAFDLHCPLMSLPRVFGTRLDTIPAAVPYLSADPAQVARWRERLAGLEGLRVGLVWNGNVRAHAPKLYALDRRRAVALRQLAPLAEIQGVAFVSLQKGDAARQAAQPPAGMTLHDWTDELADFADTAALIENLDLVIGVDTAVIHLAGALGKPVWMLNRFDTCWRWLLGRDDSPWYPTLRQFRQPAPGDWERPIAAMAAALKEMSCSSDIGR